MISRIRKYALHLKSEQISKLEIPVSVFRAISSSAKGTSNQTLLHARQVIYSLYFLQSFSEHILCLL